MSDMYVPKYKDHTLTEPFNDKPEHSVCHHVYGINDACRMGLGIFNTEPNNDGKVEDKLDLTCGPAQRIAAKAEISETTAGNKAIDPCEK